VFAPALPPFASVETRGEVLAEAVDAALAGGIDACGNVPETRPTQVNLMAHSMGGLDARFLISSLGYGDRVASLTTLSTPHRGSAMADMVLGFTANVDSQALVDLGTLLQRTVDSPSTLEPDLRAAFTALSEANADDFNRDNPDDERVHYESWAGLSNVGGIANPQDLPACENRLTQFSSRTARHDMHVVLTAIADIVAHGFDLRPNDGLVRVASAKWGNFRGCVPADHIDEIGAAPTSATPFDHIHFMRKRAFELAADGF
jgi:triacylglycerol lipase